MKRLSFILALIIALSGMIGLFVTPAYAADFDFDKTVGAGKDYATVGAALAAAGDATNIRLTLTADETITEDTADITVSANVTIVGNGAKIVVPANAAVGTSGYHWWIMADGCELSFTNVTIDTSAFNTYWHTDGAKNSGTIIPKSGATVSLDNCTANNGGTSNKDGGFVYFCNAAHYGNVIINNSTVKGGSRGIMVGKNTTGALSITIIDSTFETTKSPIQCSVTTPKSLAITAKGTTFKTPDLCIYNRAIAAVYNIIDCNFTAGAGKVVLDARNDAGTISATIAGNTFSGGEALKLKSKSGTVNLINNNFSAITSAIINHEIDGNTVVVNKYSGTYGVDTYNKVNTLNVVTDAAAGLITAGGAQLLANTTATSEKTSVRLVLKLTAEEAALADFTNIGAYVSKDANAIFCANKTTNKVYTSIKAAGYTVDAATGSYFVLVEINDIPNANFADKLYVRPFVTTADGVQVGAVASFSVNELIAATAAN